MSYWYDAEFKQLSLSQDGKELHVHYDDDYNGAIYVSIKVEDIKKLIKRL